jgi:Bacterial toxin 44
MSAIVLRWLLLEMYRSYSVFAGWSPLPGGLANNAAQGILSGEDCLSCYPLGPSVLQILQEILSGNFSAFGVPTIGDLMNNIPIMDATTGPCTNAPQSPPGASATFNASVVNQETQGMWPATKLYYFDQIFQTGGTFDYKTGGAQYMDYGNWNYGYVCAATYGPLFCQSAAGMNRMWRAATQGQNPFGSGIPFMKLPYGDQAADNQQIQNGIKAYQSGCVQ